MNLYHLLSQQSSNNKIPINFRFQFLVAIKSEISRTLIIYGLEVVSSTEWHKTANLLASNNLLSPDSLGHFSHWQALLAQRQRATCVRYVCHKDWNESL